MTSLTTRLPAPRPVLLALSAVLLVTGTTTAAAASDIPASGVRASAVRASAGAVASPGVIRPVRTCASLSTLDLTGVDTQLAAATPVVRKGHNFCAVTGYISP